MDAQEARFFKWPCQFLLISIDVLSNARICTQELYEKKLSLSLSDSEQIKRVLIGRSTEFLWLKTEFDSKTRNSVSFD